ncbi:MAG: RluA family pseudouridine synthase [Prevotella sp.]|nr:RluA family pseudouridine synthase [Prevotella sp.]
MLLPWLLDNLPGSRTRIKATLAGRGIKVNDKTVTQYNHPLRQGDRVAVSQTKDNNKFKSRYVKIVYEDEHILIIEKNAGILSMAAGHSSLNVKSVLDSYLRQTHQHCRAHVVHRLDRDTSGLMIYAKDMDTEQILERNWHDIVFDRRYIAVVSGHVEQATGTIESWLAEGKNYVTYSYPADPGGGKYAVTHYRTLAASDRFSLVEFRLETGRKNQIRVHTADIGHPVCGDGKYGDGNDPLHRLCLHAFRLCLYHPLTGEPMEFETPVPTAFARLFNQ